MMVLENNQSVFSDRLGGRKVNEAYDLKCSYKDLIIYDDNKIVFIKK